MAIRYQFGTFHDVGGIYLFDLGNAHSKEEYKTISAFSKAIDDIIDAYEAEFKERPSFLFCWLNYQQHKEKAYLLELGFKAFEQSHITLLIKDMTENADDRPRNADGRLLNNDGTIKRSPFEYFVGDRIKFLVNGAEKIGRIRKVGEGTGLNKEMQTRLHSIRVSQVVEILERAQ